MQKSKECDEGFGVYTSVQQLWRLLACSLLSRVNICTRLPVSPLYINVLK